MLKKATTQTLKALDSAELVEQWMEKWQSGDYGHDLVALHQLLMEKETSPAIMKEFAYGFYCGEQTKLDFGYLRESDPLARYAALNPYFKAIRWRDYLSQQVVRRCVEKTHGGRKPLVIILDAGFLPVVRRFKSSVNMLSQADIIACDMDSGVSKQSLDALFQHKLGIDFPDGDDRVVAQNGWPAVQYQKCSPQDLFNSQKFLGKADAVIMDGVLLHYPSNDARQQVVRKALYLLKPDGTLSCDLMAKFPEMKNNAAAFGVRKGDRLERNVARARNKMFQICANLSTTLSWQCDDERNERPIAMHFEISAPIHDIDYRLAIGKANL